MTQLTVDNSLLVDAQRVLTPHVVDIQQNLPQVFDIVPQPPHDLVVLAQAMSPNRQHVVFEAQFHVQHQLAFAAKNHERRPIFSHIRDSCPLSYEIRLTLAREETHPTEAAN